MLLSGNFTFASWSDHRGESPAAAAVREAGEEIGVDVRLVRLLDVLGGPDYEVSYPNGDRVAYVTAVYEARVVGGSPVVSDGELSELAWFGIGIGELWRPRTALAARSTSFCFMTATLCEGVPNGGRRPPGPAG